MKFELTKEQEKKFKSWKKEKYKSGLSDSAAGAAGGIWTISFTPTGLGTIVIAKCIDKTELDLTEYEYF